MKYFSFLLMFSSIFASSALANQQDLDKQIYGLLVTSRTFDRVKSYRLPKNKEAMDNLNKLVENGGSACDVFLDIIKTSKYGLTVENAEVLKWIVTSKACDINQKFSKDNKVGYNVLMGFPPSDYNTTMYFLLKYGLDLNATDDDGNNAVHYADQEDSGRILNFLAKKGVDINHKNNAGITPLMKAKFSTEKLLELGADPNLQDNDGKTALMHQVGKRAYDKLLDVSDVNLKDNEGKTILSYLVQKNYNEYDGVKQLLDMGLNVNIDGAKVYELLSNEKTKNLLIENGLILQADNGKNPISEIILSRSFDNDKKFQIIKNMVENGVDINNAGKNNVPPVLAANYDYEMLKFLQENGADLNAKNNRDEMMLFEYLDKSSIFDLDNFKKLATLNFDFNAENSSGANLIKFVITRGPKEIDTKKEVIKILVSSGCNPNKIGNENITNSILAEAKGKNVELFDLLLELGADINLRDSQGFSLYDIAKSSFRKDDMEFLKKRGAKEKKQKSGGISGILLLFVLCAGAFYWLKDKSKRDNLIKQIKSKLQKQ